MSVASKFELDGKQIVPDAKREELTDSEAGRAQAASITPGRHNTELDGLQDSRLVSQQHETPLWCESQR